MFLGPTPPDQLSTGNSQPSYLQDCGDTLGARRSTVSDKCPDTEAHRNTKWPCRSGTFHELDLDEPTTVVAGQKELAPVR